MADDKIVQIVIKGDATSAVQAADQTAQGIDKLKNTTKDLSKATDTTTEAVKEGTEKFSESRRETREAASELGRLIGVHELGTAAMGKTGAEMLLMGGPSRVMDMGFDLVPGATS